MDEIDIKVEVLTWVRRACRGRNLPIVTSEFTLTGTGIRADLAILSNTFCGIEIKSAVDTLKRLPNQMKGYARYFDQTMLVVAEKHAQGVERIDLQSAEVWIHGGPREFERVRPGACNVVAGHTLLGLLTAEEERRATRSLQCRHSAEVSDDCRRKEFESVFRRRYGATSKQFWNQVKGRPIGRADLNLLSRFYAERQRLEEARAAEDAKWSQWAHRITAASASV
jgi:hypothetical protein